MKALNIMRDTEWCQKITLSWFFKIFFPPLSTPYSGNSLCSVCNIRPAHPSVKCPLTSPLSHARSISCWFQSHKVAQSKSCFGRRPTEECGQHSRSHSITAAHRQRAAHPPRTETSLFKFLYQKTPLSSFCYGHKYRFFSLPSVCDVPLLLSAHFF